MITKGLFLQQRCHQPGSWNPGMTFRIASYPNLRGTVFKGVKRHQ